MRTPSTYRILLAVCLSTGGGLMTARALGSAASTQPVSEHDRLIQALNADAMQLASLPQAMPSDSAARQRESGRVIAIARDAIAIIDKLPPDCRGQDMASMKVSWEPLLIVFGDQAAIAQLNRDAQGTGPAAVLARVSNAMADLIKAKDDREAADAAAARVIHEAENNPLDDSPAVALLQLSYNEGLSAMTHDAVASVLSKSLSRMGGAVRFAKTRSSTQPIP